MANTDYDKLPDQFYIRYKIGYTTNSIDYDDFFKNKTINNEDQIDITDIRTSFPIEYSDYTEIKEVTLGLRKIPKGVISLLNETDSEIQTVNSLNNTYKFKIKLSQWDSALGYVLPNYPVDSLKCYLIFPNETINTSNIDGSEDPTIINTLLEKQFNNSNFNYSFTPSLTTTDGKLPYEYNGSFTENRVNYDVVTDLITVTASDKFSLITGYLVVYVNRSGINSPLMCKQVSFVNEAFTSSELFLKPTKEGLEKTDPYVTVYSNTGEKSLTVNYDIIKSRSPIIRVNLETADNNTVPVANTAYTNINTSYTKWRYYLVNNLNQEETTIIETYGVDYFRTIFGPLFETYFEQHDLTYALSKHDESKKEEIFKSYYRFTEQSNLLNKLLSNGPTDETEYSNYIKTMMDKFMEVNSNPDNFQEEEKQEVIDFMDKLYSTANGIYSKPYLVQKHILNGNYSLKLTAELYNKDDVKLTSFTTDVEVPTFSKYNDYERTDLWAGTIYKLPYLVKSIPDSLSEDRIQEYDNLYSNKEYLNRKLVIPYNPLNTNFEPLGHSESLITAFNDKLGTSISFHDEITPYHFSLFDNDDKFNYTVFDNLDQLVDMLYSLSIRVVDRHGVECFFNNDFTYFGKKDITTGLYFPSSDEEDINRFNNYVLRNNIVIYCNADGFKEIEDKKTNSSINHLYKSAAVTDFYKFKNALFIPGNKNLLTKQEIKDFLISMNFTPEYFKANKDTVSRRLAIEIYGAGIENGVVTIPLTTEAVCVVFREEIDDFIFKGHDGYLNDVIDISPTTDGSYIDYPKDLVTDLETIRQQSSNANNFSTLYKYNNRVRNIESLNYYTLNAAQINDYSSMLASQFKLFKANFDLMGIIPFRACTDKSLLGFKGDFVHRVEGYKKGQEVVHPITRDLYLCIKDRPGVTNYLVNESNFDTVTHNYPVGTPTYNVLEDTEYFVKVKSHDNLSGLSEEDYRLHYKSSLPTYVSLLSYLNLLIGSHEGLICPPIHQDLIKGYTDMIKYGNNNPYSLFSYNRIYQKLNSNCIGNTSGLMKEGIKQHNKSPLGSNEETGLEEIYVEYTNFPYHFLDAYFYETENTDFNNTIELKTNETLTDSEETQNAIKDVLFGSWIKLRNKNYHNIIYVSSRPVFWTKNAELIAGSNILHPRQHIIRVGTKHYYVRILTDNFFEDDDCCVDEIIHNNISTCDPDFQTFNDPDRLNFRESLLSSVVLTQCEIASSNTKLMKRTGKLDLESKYAYPENNPVFTIDFKNIVTNITDDSGSNMSGVTLNRSIDKDTLCIHHIGGIFRLEEKKTEISSYLLLEKTYNNNYYYDSKGVLIYNSNVSSAHYFNYNATDNALLGNNANFKTYNRPNILYNLERSIGCYDTPLKFDHTDTVLSRSSVGIGYNGISGSVKPTLYNNGYDYVFFNNVYTTGFRFYFKETESSVKSDIFLFDALLMTNQNFSFMGSDIEDLQERSLGTDSGFLKGEQILIESNTANSKYPMFDKDNESLDKIVNTPRPPEMSKYVPVHIVLEAIEESDLPIYNIKDEFKDLFKEIEKNPSYGFITKAVDTYKTLDSVINQDVNQSQYSTVTEMTNMIEKMKLETASGTITEKSTYPTYNKNTSEITIPKIRNGGYWISAMRRDIDYTLTSNLAKDLINYSTGNKNYIKTPDTYYNNNPDKSLYFMERIAYGNYDYEDAVNGNWGNYTMKTEQGITIPTYDRWNGCGYLGQFDGVSCSDLGLEYNTIFQQLDLMGLPRKQNIFNKSNNPGNQSSGSLTYDDFMNYYNKSTPLIHVYYFKGKIVLVPTWTPYDLYDSNIYGSIWKPEFDHLEVGRSKPQDRLTTKQTRVKIGSYNFDVFIPYLANDRSLHSNQELVKHVMPTFCYNK